MVEYVLRIVAWVLLIAANGWIAIRNHRRGTFDPTPIVMVLVCLFWIGHNTYKLRHIDTARTHWRLPPTVTECAETCKVGR